MPQMGMYLRCLRPQMHIRVGEGDAEGFDDDAFGAVFDLPAIMRRCGRLRHRHGFVGIPWATNRAKPAPM